MIEGRPSITAALVAGLRALYTAQPTPRRLGDDPYAASLVPLPLAFPARLVARAPWAGEAVHNALGLASLGISWNIPLRTRAIDDALCAAIEGGVRQTVLLGAGLDSRALRLPALQGTSVFEVDHPSTQRYKRARLAAIGVAPPKGLTYVAMSFERDSLRERMIASGFLPDEPSFWIWEGVVVYLTREAITSTLRDVVALSAPGTKLAVTYTPPFNRVIRMAEPFAQMLAAMAGEHVRSFLAQSEMAALLGDAGLSVVDDASTNDWARRYWPSLRGPASPLVERLAIAAR